MKAFIQSGGIKLVPESQLESDELTRLHFSEKREFRRTTISNPKDYPWRTSDCITLMTIYFKNTNEVYLG